MPKPLKRSPWVTAGLGGQQSSGVMIFDHPFVGAGPMLFPQRRDLLMAGRVAAVTLLAVSTPSTSLVAGAKGGTIRVVIDGAASGLNELCRAATDVPGVQVATCWIEGNALAARGGQVAPVRVRG